MSSSLLAKVERARGRFRQDVADQLQMAAGRAGLAATVTLEHDRAVLEVDAPVSDGSLARIVAAFRNEKDREPGDAVTLFVEMGDERTTLLDLAWRDDPGLGEEAALQQRLAELKTRTDERLPLDRRGLNATADVRTGPYAKGEVARQLAGDLKRAASAAPGPSRALVVVEERRPVEGRSTHREERSITL